MDLTSTPQRASAATPHAYVMGIAMMMEHGHAMTMRASPASTHQLHLADGSIHGSRGLECSASLHVQRLRGIVMSSTAPAITAIVYTLAKRSRSCSRELRALCVACTSSASRAAVHSAAAFD